MPQRMLYVQALLLRKGRNQIVVLELHDAGTRAAVFRAARGPSRSIRGRRRQAVRWLQR